jgi:mannosyltransferase OCH1-like enzyme
MTASAPKIPKIIHQVWFQFAPNKPSTPPAEYDEMRQSWRDFHPEWEIKLWDKEAAVAFLQQYYPESLPVFHSYKKEIMRVDAIRYFLLHHFGGFYTDVDTMALRSLDPLVDNHVVLVKDVTPWLLINNGFMGATPGHPLMERCCKNLHRTAMFPNPITATGPLYLASHWLTTKNKEELTVLRVQVLKKYFDHIHSASWTWISEWRKALDPRRRQYMTLEEVPCPLRFFMKGKVGGALA